MTDPFDFSKAKLPTPESHFGFSSKSKIPVPESPFLSTSRQGFLSDLGDQLFFDEHGVPLVEPIPKTLDKPPPYSYGTPGILYDPSSVPRSKSRSPTPSLGGIRGGKKWKRPKAKGELVRSSSDVIEQKLLELLGGDKEGLSDTELESLRERLSKSADDLTLGDSDMFGDGPGMLRKPTPEERKKIGKLLYMDELKDPKVPLPRLPQLPLEEKPKPGAFTGSAKSLLKLSKAFAKKQASEDAERPQSKSSDDVSAAGTPPSTALWGSAKRLTGSLPSVADKPPRMPLHVAAQVSTSAKAAHAFKKKAAKPRGPSSALDMVQLQALKMMQRQGLAPSSDEEGLLGSRDSSVERSKSSMKSALTGAKAFSRRPSPGSGGESRESSTERGKRAMMGAVGKASMLGKPRRGDPSSSRESSTERGKSVIGAVAKASSFVSATEVGKSVKDRAARGEASATPTTRKGTKKGFKGAATVAAVGKAGTEAAAAAPPPPETPTATADAKKDDKTGKIGKDGKPIKDAAKDMKGAAKGAADAKPGVKDAAAKAVAGKTPAEMPISKESLVGRAVKDAKDAPLAPASKDTKPSAKGSALKATSLATGAGKKVVDKKSTTGGKGAGKADESKDAARGFGGADRDDGMDGGAGGGDDEDPSKPPPEIKDKPFVPPKNINSVALRVLLLSAKSDWHGVDQALRYLEKSIVMGILEESKPLAGVADPTTGWSPLMYALKDNRIPMADRMLDLGADINHRNKVTSSYNFSKY